MKRAAGVMQGDEEKKEGNMLSSMLLEGEDDESLLGMRDCANSAVAKHPRCTHEAPR